MKTWLKQTTFAFCLAIAFGFVFTAHRAEAQTGLVASAEAGLDDYCKVNRWLPVKFTLENNSTNIEGQLFATTTDGASDWTFTREVSVPSVSRKEYTIYTYGPNGRPSEIIVGLRAEDELLYSDTIRLNCVDPDDLLLGVWAQNPSFFNPQLEIDTSGSRAALLILDETSLPDRVEGLQMLDTLTISGVDTSRLSPAQVNAIQSWVSRGGKLIVTGGPLWQETAAAWPANFLPLQPGGTATLADLTSLQNFAPSSELLEGSAVIATGRLQPDAISHAAQTEIPLIAERSYGFGKVIYFTVDPTLAPIRTWTGAGELYKVLLGSSDDTPPWSQGFSEWSSANDALNTIEGLGMPSYLLVCGFILVYILVIGPINFYWLRKRQKHDAAWLTIPVLVILFTAAILLVSSSVMGNRPIINRLTIVQVWENSDRAGVNGLVGVFSPQRETYSLENENQLITQPLPVIGFAPERYNHSIYQSDETSGIPDVRVDVGGMAGYAVSGELPAPEFEADFQMDINLNGDFVLHGEFRNNSALQFEDAVLLSGALPRQVGTIHPGQSVTISANFSGGNTSATSSNPVIAPGPSGMDGTLNDLFGTSYMYPSNTISAEMYRRFNLVNAAVGGPYNSRGNGVYLFAWTNRSPYETRLSGAGAGTADTTLYIFHIEPKVNYTVKTGDRITLPPGMFEWSAFEPAIGSVTATPYDGYLGPGEYSIRFAPTNTIEYTSIETLTLHLESYGATGKTDLDLALWDFVEGTWSVRPPLDWGDSNIPSPERFVGPGGEIRVKLINPTPYAISVQQADFTLTVKH